MRTAHDAFGGLANRQSPLLQPLECQPIGRTGHGYAADEGQILGIDGRRDTADADFVLLAVEGIARAADVGDLAARRFPPSP